MPPKINLRGKRYGWLRVLAEGGRTKQGAILWKCRCRCGRLKEIRSFDLQSGASKSCGCRIGEVCRARSLTHGQYNSKLYKCWAQMKQRCLNPNNPRFYLWGGRGIKVCKRWTRFENFAADMGKSFCDGLEIERRDNNGNYEPGNCHWVTCSQQQRNKRTNHKITIGGKTKIATEWSESSGVKLQTILRRVRVGDIGAEIIRPVK